MTAPSPPVAITGLGAVSAAGNTVPETLAAFEQGRNLPGPATRFPTALAYPVFEVHNSEAPRRGNEIRTLRLTRAAVRQALTQAGLGQDLSGFRVGVCLGTTVASQLNDMDFYRTYRQTGAAPMAGVDRYLKSNLAQAVAREFHASGPCVTVVNACSGGADAIGVALAWLKKGFCDMALAGGADELSIVSLSGFGALGIVSSAPCSPFDRDRSGLNLGEGAGIMVLETETSRQRRGRPAALYMAGYGAAADAHHLTAPHPEGRGLAAAITRALANAGILPGDIGFVNAHGTATPDNDRVEGRVLSRIFGRDILFFSTKGHTGHTLGAAGGLETVFTAAALQHGWIPASAGFKNRDEEISIVPVTEKTAVQACYGLSTSLAFGGNNSALVIRIC